MKDITFTGNRTLDIMNFADPTPGPHDVVLEIKASGMYGTDLGAY
jgi:D-arabinose 1-dehydrogenase-like Zn-dependent alcohol dehydrogenase